MKTKLLQLYVYFNNIDRRYLQWAKLAFMLAMFFIASPEDGGSGTR